MSNKHTANEIKLCDYFE